MRYSVRWGVWWRRWRGSSVLVPRASRPWRRSVPRPVPRRSSAAARRRRRPADSERHRDLRPQQHNGQMETDGTLRYGPFTSWRAALRSTAYCVMVHSARHRDLRPQHNEHAYAHASTPQSCPWVGLTHGLGRVGSTFFSYWWAGSTIGKVPKIERIILMHLNRVR